MVEPRQIPLKSCPKCKGQSLHIVEVRESVDPNLSRDPDEIMGSTPVPAFVYCLTCGTRGATKRWERPGDVPKLLAAASWNAMER